MIKKVIMVIVIAIVAVIVLSLCYSIIFKQKDENIKIVSLETADPIILDNTLLQKLTEGTYEVGIDIEEGEYLLISNTDDIQASFFEVSNDIDFNIDNIERSGMFKVNVYITIKNGEYIRFTDSDAYMINNNALYSENYKYESGMFKVGKDIDAGKYVIMPKEDIYSGTGIYKILKDSLHNGSSIIETGIIDGEKVIILEKSQYLILDDVYISEYLE